MRKSSFLSARILVLLAAITLQGCGAFHRTAVQSRPALGTVYQPRQAGFTAEQTKDADKNCFKGIPQKTARTLGPTELVFREGYVLEHSSLDKIPLWVCEGVDESQLTGNLDRDDKFATDPALKGPHAAPKDYAGSGYDRGHQAPAGNQTTDAKLKQETFFMSNMAPQLPGLNRQSWKALETQTRAWVKQFSHAYEITGPVFYDPKEDETETAVGTLDNKTIGKSAIAVPTHFYKIFVAKKGGDWKCIAFVMPNKKYNPPYHLENYIQSVSWIEQHTGLNFMPDLTAQQQQDLEAHESAMWP